MSQDKSSRTASVLSGRNEVPPSAILGALDQIRRDAAAMDAKRDQREGAEAAPRVRATLSNLVLLVAEPEAVSRAELDAVLDELCVSYPSRFIVVGLEPDAAEDANVLRTAVSSRCVLARSGAHVCSEEAYLSVQPQTVSLVPSMLRSLLVPDMEVVLMTFGDPRCDPAGKDKSLHSLFAGLLPLVDLLVYDSRSFASFAESSRCLEELAAHEQERFGDELPRRDLNWLRLKRWRLLIAEIFDRPVHGKSADDIRRVRLAGGSGSLPAEAFLLAGWFHSSLQLELAGKAERIDGGVAVASRRRDGAAVTFEFVAAEGADNVIDSLEIALGEGADPARVTISRSKDKQELCISSQSPGVTPSGANACELFLRKVPNPEETFESLIFAGLGTPGAVSEYVRAQRIAQELARVIER